MKITEVDVFYYKKGVYEIKYEDFNSNKTHLKIIKIDENFSKNELKIAIQKKFNIKIYKIKNLKHLGNTLIKKSKCF